VLLGEVHEPNSYVEAINHFGWKEAMNQDLQLIQKNQTWEVVD
jgi:hypothetical protein